MLIFAFTHFDKVSGDNLPNPSARSQHVLASAENALSAIGEDLGPFAERALRARLKTSRVFLADLDKKLDVESKDGKRTASQLGKLLEMIDGIVERPKPINSRPIYDRMNLVLAVERAAEIPQRVAAPPRPIGQAGHGKGALDAHQGPQPPLRDGV